ncbi:MAG: ABC transporter substrate-binding protein [Elusimicrobia bacterium]|nr:ABC transporter substrate-binding protein [Elusimicrobiota bacterium]
MKTRRIVVCDDNVDPGALDPFFTFSEKKFTLLQQMLEGLVRFDSEANIVPSLAKSWERVSPLRMRFHLRHGVRFHNGEPFNAESVRFTLERSLDPKTGSPLQGFLASIDRIEDVDPYTVDIITKFPDGLLLRRLAGLVLLVPPKDYENKGPSRFAKSPNGTGPFKLKYWSSGKEIVMERNVDYWDSSLPKIDELVMSFLPNVDEQLEGLLDGHVDLMTELPGTYTLKVAEAPNAHIVKKEALYAVGGHFNTAIPPFNDVRVRQAVNYALNKAEFIRYDLLGNGEAVSTVATPGQIGYNKKLIPYPFNLSKAKELLREAGVQLPITIDVFLVPFVERPARIAKKQLEAIGINAVLHVFPDGDAVEEFKKGTWNLGMATFPSPTAHVSFSEGLLFYSKSHFSMHKDPSFDSAFEKAMMILDSKESDLAFQEIERKVHEDALGMFLYRRIKTYAVSQRINFRPYLTGMPHYSDAVSIETAKQ